MLTCQMLILVPNHVTMTWHNQDILDLRLPILGICELLIHFILLKATNLSFKIYVPLKFNPVH